MGLRSFLLLLALLTGSSGSAKHLVGGSLTYDYVGQTPSGDPQYKVKLRIYRDATPPTTPFDQDVTIGIYHDDWNNNLAKTLQISYSGEKTLSFPDISEDCAFSPNLDFRVSTYEATTTLPSSNDGYHLAFVRCCRNNLLNLEKNAGQTYYAYIPPTNQSPKNSSPQFADTPVPYVCVGDTINISYGTNDPDADSLVYNIVKPYDGADSALPKPGPPANLDSPIQKVPFVNGYSAFDPFGPNGVAKINSNSGIATFYIPNQGNYAMAVEIKEYRNETLVGITRRDLQFVALNCPENDPPDQIDTSHTTIKTNFSIKEGDTLKFPIIFKDEDKMTLNHSGPIFNSSGAIEPPYANIGNPVGKDTISTTFYWPSKCGHGRDQPYFVDIKVEDDGCPPKTKVRRYKINVDKFKGVRSISGQDSLCLNDPQASYEAKLPNNFEYPVYWETVGGAIISRPSKAKINAKWNDRGEVVKAWSKNENKCPGDTARLPINVTDTAEIAINHDTAICHEDSLVIGKSPEHFPDSANILWLDSTFLDSANIPNPVFKGPNYGLSPKIYQLRAKINYRNCHFIDTVKVKVNPKPSINRLIGPDLACHKSHYTYSVPNDDENRLKWYIQGADFKDTITSGSDIKVQWTNPDSGKIQVQKINKAGCISDTFEQVIKIENPVIDTVKGPTVVCPNSSNMQYKVDSENAHYHWSTDSAQLTGKNGKPYNTVSFGDSGQSFIYVQEETANGCLSDTFVLPVLISYQLETTPITGDTSVCEFSVKNYRVEDRNGSTFNWFLTGGAQLAPNGNHRVKVEWNSAPNNDAMLKVLETSYDSVNEKECKGDTLYQPIKINPNPETSNIKGDSTICENQSAIYNVAGFPNSSFHWELKGPGTLIWQKGDSIKIRADSPGEGMISVYELSKDSCKGPLINKGITIHPKPASQTIQGPEHLCIPDQSRYRFNYPGRSTSRFEWFSDKGTIIATNNKGKEVHVQWNNGGNSQIAVLETNKEGCLGDTVTKALSIDQYELLISHVTTQRNNDSVIDVHGNIISQNSNKQAALMRKRGEGNWYLEDSIKNRVFVFPDGEPDPSESYHDYKLAGLDACGNEQESLVHRTIHLKGKKTKSNSISLQWNHYKGWGDNLKGYEVYRSLNESENFEKIATLSPSDTSATFEADTLGYEQCYRVKGINNGKEDIHSWSNIECFPFESRIYVPNAFTPEISGNLNDEFKIEGYNIKEFNMKVYNRWGEKLFESNDQERGWDGTYKGEKASEGSYIVIITHKGAIKENTYQGTITLIK